jgi:hypothetical protein
MIILAAILLSIEPLVVPDKEFEFVTGLGSCLAPDRRPLDLRRVALLQNRELLLDSKNGRVRAVLEGQKVSLHIEGSPDDEHIVRNIGDLVGGSEGRADVFLTLGFLDNRPVLYWRETYQHRSFRQGLLSISPEAARADWAQVLTPMCEGRGGVDTSH